jgi:hypothetical protein
MALDNTKYVTIFRGDRALHGWRYLNLHEFLGVNIIDAAIMLNRAAQASLRLSPSKDPYFETLGIRSSAALMGIFALLLYVFLRVYPIHSSHCSTDCISISMEVSVAFLK